VYNASLKKIAYFILTRILLLLYVPNKYAYK